MGAERFIVSVDVSDELDKILRDIAGRLEATYRALHSFERLITEITESDVGVVVLEDAGDGSRSEVLQQCLRSRDGFHPPLLVVRSPRLEPAVSAMRRGVFAVHRFAPTMHDLETSIRDAMKASTRIVTHVRYWQRVSEQLDGLTEGELRVLRFMLDGYLNKRIARTLEISERTVEARRKRIFEKMGTHSVAQLVRIIVETVGVDEIARRCDSPHARPPVPHLEPALMRVAERAYGRTLNQESMQYGPR